MRNAIEWNHLKVYEHSLRALYDLSCVAMVTVPSPVKHIKIQSSLVELAPCQFWAAQLPMV